MIWRVVPEEVIGVAFVDVTGCSQSFHYYSAGSKVQ